MKIDVNFLEWDQKREEKYYQNKGFREIVSQK